MLRTALVLVAILTTTSSFAAISACPGGEEGSVVAKVVQAAQKRTSFLEAAIERQSLLLSDRETYASRAKGLAFIGTALSAIDGAIIGSIGFPAAMAATVEVAQLAVNSNQLLVFGFLSFLAGGPIGFATPIVLVQGEDFRKFIKVGEATQYVLDADALIASARAYPTVLQSFRAAHDKVNAQYDVALAKLKAESHWYHLGWDSVREIELDAALTRAHLEVDQTEFLTLNGYVGGIAKVCAGK